MSKIILMVNILNPISWSKQIANLELQIAVNQLLANLIGGCIQHQNAFLLELGKGNLTLGEQI
jgi:hypothetical protein